MRATLPVVSILILAAAASASDNFIAVPTELRVSSVSVSIRAPLGLRYRAGELFPLEIHIDNPGAAINAELSAAETGNAESGGGWAERAVPSVPITLPTGKFRVTLPTRAPSVSASIVLTLRGGGASDGSGRAELFRASLARILHPLPAGGRVILVCGGGIAPHGPSDQTAQLSAAELPAENWMWESVDWVVLNDGSIKDAHAERREALRRWLAGGGRLFLGSREAFAAALSARLLPLEQRGDIGSDMQWWEKNAGLTQDDVLASKNFRPVYARMRMGLGQIVFLFPGSDPAGVDGAAVFNRPDIQRPRAALPDARVQPDRFSAFVPATAGTPRRNAVMLWTVLGSLLICAALFFARSSRSKIEALFLPVGAGALLTALIANGFPRPELMVSRIRWERSGANGAHVREEWALLDSFRDKLGTSARGPLNGTLTPCFDEIEDLREAGLDRWRNDDGRLALARIVAAPNQPTMLHARVDEILDSAAAKEAETVLRISGRTDAPRANAASLEGVGSRRVIWIRANREVWLLQKAQDDEAYNAAEFTVPALETMLAKDTDSATAKARAVALKWAVNEALGRGGGVLVLWSDAAQKVEPLIAIDGAAPNSGTEFLMRSIEAK